MNLTLRKKGSRMSAVKHGPFQLISTRQIYANPWIRVREDTVIRPGGTEGIFGVIEMLAGSSVFALTADNRVYLAREFKYGIQRYSVELMSGGLDPEETPLQAAKREMREEFGLEAREWVGLGEINPFTNLICSPNYLFLALDVEQKYEPSPDPGEKIEILTAPLQQVVDMVMNNEITNGSSCTLILKAYYYLQKIGRV
jgi:8-oxo-dGTP pyrophosphatase MutT (NUDIX family)